MKTYTSPGMRQRSNHVLVIPLALRLHSMGPDAIDGGMGVRSWEAKFGRQLYWLKWVAEQLNDDRALKLIGLDLETRVDKFEG